MGRVRGVSEGLRGSCIADLQRMRGDPKQLMHHQSCPQCRPQDNCMGSHVDRSPLHASLLHVPLLRVPLLHTLPMHTHPPGEVALAPGQSAGAWIVTVAGLALLLPSPPGGRTPDSCTVPPPLVLMAPPASAVAVHTQSSARVHAPPASWTGAHAGAVPLIAADAARGARSARRRTAAAAAATEAATGPERCRAEQSAPWTRRTITSQTARLSASRRWIAVIYFVKSSLIPSDRNSDWLCTAGVCDTRRLRLRGPAIELKRLGL